MSMEQARLESLSALLRGHQYPGMFVDRVLESIARSGLAARSALGWQRLIEAAGEPGCLHKLVDEVLQLPSSGKTRGGLLDGLTVMLGASSYFTDMVAARPDRIVSALSRGPLYLHRTRSQMDRDLQKEMAELSERSFEERRDAAAEFQRVELLRLGWRDYGDLSDPETNARELSDLADVLIRWACREAWMDAVAKHGRPETAPDEATEAGAALGTESSLIVVGMGKLGGRELNFSSDVDLVFIYDAEGQTTGRKDGGGSVSHHQFFGRMCEHICRIIGQRGPHGQFYRVDLRLRPEGALGPVARSLESLESYFGEQARDWERVSWLKSRAITGADRLIHRFEQVVTGFVYSPILPERLFSEVESLKQRIDAAIGEAESGLCMDVKRGRGGIREIEFTVTVLQVLYGSRHRALRVRPLLEALARLAHVGLISGNDPIKLAMNYGYLRRVEHRLQMEHGRQEHRLPPLGERRDTLALSLGLPDGDGLTEFMARVTEEVHAWYARFFEADRGASTEEDNDVALILSPVADPDQQAAALARRGFSNPHTATLLRSLALGTTEVFVSAAGQRAFEQLVPGLLRLSAGRPRPDQVIVHLHTLMHRLHSASYYYELLAAHPGVLRMVTFLFGTSDHLSEVLLACPEYFDRIIQGAVLDEADPERRRQSMLERIRSSMVAARTLEAQRRILRRAAEFEILTAYLAWLVNLATFEETLTALSDGADCVVQSALDLAVKSVAQRHKMDDSSALELARTVEQRLLVVGLGKYGSRELNFRGDLDVIFVDLGEDAQNGLDGEGSVPLHEVAQEVSAILSEGSGIGRGHVLDTRLRPWGNDGPLVAGAGAWISYTRDHAAAWEFLSYQRMRLVAGPVKPGLDLLARIQAEVRRAVDDRIGRREFVEEVLGMKVRLEEQVAGATGLEIKRSRGGITDTEFALEAWLALGRPGWSEQNQKHGPMGLSGNEEQSTVGTRTHFDWWLEVEFAGVGPEDAATVLGHVHRQLRLAENVARTVVGTSHSVLLPRESSEQAAALWRNLAIVGLKDEATIEGIRVACHEAWKRWMAWLHEGT